MSPAAMLLCAAGSVILLGHLRSVRYGEKRIRHTAMDPPACQMRPAALITIMSIDRFVDHLQLDVPIHP